MRSKGGPHFPAPPWGAAGTAVWAARVNAGDLLRVSARWSLLAQRAGLAGTLNFGQSWKCPLTLIEKKPLQDPWGRRGEEEADDRHSKSNNGNRVYASRGRAEGERETLKQIVC